MNGKIVRKCMKEPRWWVSTGRNFCEGLACAIKGPWRGKQQIICIESFTESWRWASHIHSEGWIAHRDTVIRLKQVDHVNHEREILAAVAGHPFITTLIATFSDYDSLYMLVSFLPDLHHLLNIKSWRVVPCEIARLLSWRRNLLISPESETLRWKYCALLRCWNCSNTRIFTWTGGCCL